jgi:hypothetical protein
MGYSNCPSITHLASYLGPYQPTISSLRSRIPRKPVFGQAKALNGCGFGLGPKYAGSALFSKKAKLGLCLHRLPCDSKPKRN